jgi:hypothetical protein
MVTPLPVVMIPTMRSPGSGMATSREVHRHARDQPANRDLLGLQLAASRRLAGLAGLRAGSRDRHDVGAALARLLQPRIDGRQDLAGPDETGPDRRDEIVRRGLLEIDAHAVERLFGQTS